jgi:threonine dehydrogenase-like Zn-dependent dehydrogenase
MSLTALRLAADGRLALEPLVTHVVPDTDAPAAFEMLDGDAQDALQVVLDYGTVT